jgi:hypothetical protein
MQQNGVQCPAREQAHNVVGRKACIGSARLQCRIAPPVERDMDQCCLDNGGSIRIGRVVHARVFIGIRAGIFIGIGHICVHIVANSAVRQSDRGKVVCRLFRPDDVFLWSIRFPPDIKI